VKIYINEGNVTITWNEVADAAETPDGTFVNVTNEGTFDGENWSSGTDRGDTKFFYVTAISDDTNKAPKP
jgi:hypothetical protein